MSSLAPLRVRQVLWRTLLAVLGSLVLLAGGLVVTAAGVRLADIPLALIGLMTVLIFGGFAVVGLRLLLGTPLVIDVRGAWDNMSGLSVGHIPWGTEPGTTAPGGAPSMSPAGGRP